MKMLLLTDINLVYIRLFYQHVENYLKISCVFQNIRGKKKQNYVNLIYLFIYFLFM